MMATVVLFTRQRLITWKTRTREMTSSAEILTAKSATVPLEVEGGNSPRIRSARFLNLALVIASGHC